MAFAVRLQVSTRKVKWVLSLLICVLFYPILSRLRASPQVPSTAAQDDREARYCAYRSQWAFPSSSPTLAIWTNSSSEHPRAHLSHCCFLPKSRAHASAPANTIWPLRAFMPALMPSVSLLLRSEVRCRQSSRCLQMFFGLLHAAWAAGAVISKVAGTTMPNTNGILPCVIAIFLCPNLLPPPASRPGYPSSSF